MAAIEATIAELALDLDNPRIPGATSQREALQRILDDQQEKLVNLARSIVLDGLNPMDRFLVVRKGKRGSLIVLEGNRRLAALKILANPTILQDLTVAKKNVQALNALAKSFDRTSVEPLSCYEVASREDGNGWVHLRHTGENEGMGIVGWSGLAASRFRGREPALQALEFVREHGALTDIQLAAINDRFPITTLDRLISSREVRSRLGFDVHDGKLVSALPPGELLKPLRRIVLDLAQKKVKVTDVKNREMQIAYVDKKFGPEDRPNLGLAGSEMRPIETVGKADFSPRARTPAKRVSDPSKRRTLAPTRLKLNITDNRIAAIYSELRKVRVDECPNAAAVLFRVFLELSVDHYMDVNGLPKRFTAPTGGKQVEKKLQKKVLEVIDHLVASGGNKKDYDSVTRGISDRKSPLFMDLLHAYVHNRFSAPIERELLSAWDNAQGFFQRIWS